MDTSRDVAWSGLEGYLTRLLGASGLPTSLTDLARVFRYIGSRAVIRIFAPVVGIPR